MELVKRLLKNKHSGKAISFLCGLGLVCILFACNEEDCIHAYIGPKISELKEVFRMGDKCVKYKEKSVKCEPNKKKLNFA